MPDACFKDAVENMESMLEVEFDTLWFQNDKVFKEAKAVFRYANLKRK